MMTPLCPSMYQKCSQKMTILHKIPLVRTTQVEHTSLRQQNSVCSCPWWHNPSMRKRYHVSPTDSRFCTLQTQAQLVIQNWPSYLSLDLGRYSVLYPIYPTHCASFIFSLPIGFHFLSFQQSMSWMYYFHALQYFVDIMSWFIQLRIDLRFGS